jgi:hypothetical protein
MTTSSGAKTFSNFFRLLQESEVNVEYLGINQYTFAFLNIFVEKSNYFPGDGLSENYPLGKKH